MPLLVSVWYRTVRIPSDALESNVAATALRLAERSTTLRRMILPTRSVGRPKERVPDAVTANRKALALYRQMEKLNPFEKPHGFVFKARTREEYEHWKACQGDPRLW